MMTNEKLEAYKKEFIEWGKWTRHNPDRLYYPNTWFELIMRDNTPQQVRGYQMTDDRALVINDAVTALSRHSLLLYNIFLLSYVGNCNLRQLSAYLRQLKKQGKYRGNLSIHGANNLLNSATGFVVGVLTCYTRNDTI